jgi:translation elongation factor EF-Tu-like GTPase
MESRHFGVRLEVQLWLLTREQGGLPVPIFNGYRPLVVVSRPSNGEVVIGLSELQLDQPIPPGQTGTAMLAFDRAVESEVRSLLHPGTIFSLAEGKRIIAKAQVLNVR